MTSLRSFSELLERIAAHDGRMLVGVVGPPGSGKSTVAAEIVAALGPEAMALGMDGFHLAQNRLVELGSRERMGAADTFDVVAFVETLTRLRAGGRSVFAPVFDRNAEEAVPDAISIPATVRVIVVEGNYLLLGTGGWGAVRPLLDASVFLRLDRGIRLHRLIERHRQFGKTPEAALAWATGPDEVNARLIEATASRADVELRLP